MTTGAGLPGTPHVSVVVPCHNREDTAAAAIRSVLEQEYPAFDVIAVDDRSEDDTRAVLDAIGDPRLRVVDNARGPGVSGARNTGIDLAQGPWVAFQDSDDLWKPGKLAAQMARVAAMPDAVAVYCGMEIRDGETRLGRVPSDDQPHAEGDILPGLIHDSFVSTQTLVVRADVLAAVGGFDEDLHALVDWELMLRVARQGPVAYVPDPLVIQHMSGNSITRSTRRRLAAQERVLEKHRALMAQDPAALARHLHRVAGGHRQFGQFPAALVYAREAARTAPSWRYRLAAAYTQLRALTQ